MTRRRRSREAKVATETPQELDYLDVDVGIVDPDDLGSELPVLAVATGLWLLGPEVRGEVPDLPRRGRAVLHEGAHDGRGAFGPQREPAPAAVDEVVHLLAHDVGGLPTPREDLVVLEDRGQQQAIAEPLRPAREPLDYLDPASGVRREHVEHALGGAHDVSIHWSIRRHGRHATQQSARDRR